MNYNKVNKILSFLKKQSKLKKKKSCFLVGTTKKRTNQNYYLTPYRESQKTIYAGAILNGNRAAKKLATDLAGKELKDGEKNFKDFLKGMSKSEDPDVQQKANMFFQEEDSRMTNATTGELPPLVFWELHTAAGGTDTEAGTDQAAFETALAEHFTVNETGLQRIAAA